MEFQTKLALASYLLKGKMSQATAWLPRESQKVTFACCTLKRMVLPKGAVCRRVPVPEGPIV